MQECAHTPTLSSAARTAACAASASLASTLAASAASCSALGASRKAAAADTRLNTHTWGGGGRESGKRRGGESELGDKPGGADALHIRQPVDYQAVHISCC